MSGFRNGVWKGWQRGFAVLGGTLWAVACLSACPGPGPGRVGPGGSRGPAARKDPTVELRKFDGRSGVLRIHNGTRRTILRVAVGLRGVGCEGPRATRTTVKVFDLRLRPGERQSFAFRFDYRCRRAHVAVAAQ